MVEYTPIMKFLIMLVIVLGMLLVEIVILTILGKREESLLDYAEPFKEQDGE